MKLIELAISNYKRIKAVELRPGDGTFIVGGRNAQGKTSVLDALENLFNGARVACERPIRTGAEAASIKGTLDSGLTVKRTFDSVQEGSIIRLPGYCLPFLVFWEYIECIWENG